MGLFQESDDILKLKYKKITTYCYLGYIQQDFDNLWLTEGYICFIPDYFDYDVDYILLARNLLKFLYHLILVCVVTLEVTDST